MALTEQDIRDFILDRSVDDNAGLDLSFSSADIAQAMKRAAREYNSIPPVFIQVDDKDHLPSETNMFLDATAEQLYISEKARLTRDDIDYSAGGVVTPIARQRIKHLDDLIKFHGERFQTAAKAQKLTANLRRAYRHY